MGHSREPLAAELQSGLPVKRLPSRRWVASHENLRNLCNLRIFIICVNLRSSAVKVFIRIYSCPFAVAFNDRLGPGSVLQNSRQKLPGHFLFRLIQNLCRRPALSDPPLAQYRNLIGYPMREPHLMGY